MAIIALMNWPAWTRYFRGRRSASTPPTIDSTSPGIDRASATVPSAAKEPVSVNTR